LKKFIYLKMKYRLFIKKIDKSEERYVTGQKVEHTHLICIRAEINGDVYDTPIIPIVPSELKLRYTELVSEISIERQRQSH